MTISQAAGAAQTLTDVRTGVRTVQDVARACLETIERRDPAIRAWSHVDPAAVLANARDLDAATITGALHGLPVGVKDVIATRDMPTQYNSDLYLGHQSARDAACVSILRAAGALILGKTDTVEFAATGRKAKTRNPHDMARTPGGSSSGSAAAVADGHVPIALGTQTGGSMIRPASYCSVYAIKPTWGLISTEGVSSFAPTLDTLGWFARSADDLRLLYDVFDTEAAAYPAPDLARMNIGICRTPFWDQADSATRSALEAAVLNLREAGARTTDITLPKLFERLNDLQLTIMASEGRASFLPEYRVHGEGLHPNLRAYVDNNAGYSRADLRSAYDIAARCRETFDILAGEFDAVLTPSVVGEAPLGLAQTGAMTFNAMWTLLHVPCINVPGFTGPAGMPVGLTVTAPRFADRQALAAASAMSTAFVRQATA